jgi:hypothetical protein
MSGRSNEINELLERFSRDAAIFVPRRRIADDGSIDLDDFMIEVNETVVNRGIVLADGQIVKKPFNCGIGGYELFGDDSVFETPGRTWGPSQQQFFGLKDPYQMAEEPGGFLWWHVMAFVVEPFLAPGELIAGLVHGETDGGCFECECHESTVVYTMFRRLVCMSCGYLHLVLEKPLDIRSETLLSSEEWVRFFDHEGDRRHEEVDLAIVDYRQIENAEVIWKTDRWEHASREFVFFSRTPPDELAAAIRGTELDGSIFAEAGFERVDLPPSPALQLDARSINVDLISNAAHAFRAGVAAYTAAYTRKDELVNAVPHLFRAIELLLKARLEDVETNVVEGLNNQTVLRRLEQCGVSVAPADKDTITSLRRLRNRLQHGSARFNYRMGLGLCRRAVIFINAFAASELGLYSRDVVTRDDWQKLLLIPEIASSARSSSEKVLAPFRKGREGEITTCPRCGENTLLRPYPDTGAYCVYCRHIPVT